MRTRINFLIFYLFILFYFDELDPKLDSQFHLCETRTEIVLIYILEPEVLHKSEE